MTRICIQEKIHSGVPHPCEKEELLAFLNSPEVAEVCEAIAALDPKAEGYSDKKNELKRRLPVITPHARSFAGDGTRKNANAEASGLALLDIDGVANPRDIYTMQVEAVLTAAKIHFVSVTPSGRGLRLIFERELGESIEDAMLRVAKICGFEEIDGATKDLARASYLVPMGYVLHMTDGLFSYPSAEAEGYWMKAPSADAEKPETTRSDRPQERTLNNSLEEVADGALEQVERDAEGRLCFKGVPYEEIVQTLINRSGGNPCQGERNSFYYSLAKQVRYICDFNAEVVMAVLPDFGLSEQERKGECERACKAVRKGYTPQEVLSAVKIAELNTQQENATGDSSLTEDADALVMPKLPRMLNIICRRIPEAYRPAMVIASLPVIGTIATRLRFTYLDGQEHSPSFLAAVCSPAATGKSFLRKALDLMLTTITEQDEEEWEKERAYKERLQRNKNAKSQPEDPHACPRNIGVAISEAKLLQLMTYSDGRHLLAISEEMDSLTKNGKNSWGIQSDLIRQSFDNSVYTKMNMSDASYNTKVRVYLNLLLEGTPHAFDRYFRDVEDGTCTRFAIAKLPDMKYARLPRFEDYTEAEQREVIQWTQRLAAEEGMVTCKMVDDAVSEWLEDKRKACDLADCTSGEILRRRCGVIGFRAGMLAYVMEGRANRKCAADFAVWVAEYVFRNQMELWAEKMEALDQSHTTTAQGLVQSLLDQLPQDFTTSDLVVLRAKKGQSTQMQSIKQVLKRWRANGRIEHTGNKQWRKR